MTDAEFWVSEFWVKVAFGSPDAVLVAWHRWRHFARQEEES